MVEYIEKDKAIEAVKNIVCSMSVCMSTEEFKGMNRMQKRVIEVLTELPSAQPDKDALDDAYAHGYTAAESEFRKRMEKPEPKWIPIFKAKDEDSDLWVKGFYFAYPETTYCFTEDYERDPVKIIHCITFHRMTDWCLPNRPTVCNIDIDTLELVGWVDSKRKTFGNEPWILPEPWKGESDGKK